VCFWVAVCTITVVRREFIHERGSRVTFRTLAVAAVLLTAVACSKGATPAASTAPSSAPTATPAASSSSSPQTSAPAGTPHCRTNDLSASVATSGAAAGTAYDELTFTNHSSAACTLTGYPGVSLADASGNQIGQPATRNSVHPSDVVTLQGNGYAYSLLGFPNPGNFPSGKCSSTKSTSLRVFPPGETQSLLVPLVETYCPGFSVAAVSASKT